MERKLDSNCIRILQAVLNKSWKQHPTKQQQYKHLPSILKTIQIRRARHAGHYWRHKGELVSDVLLWTCSHRQARVGQPLYNSFELIQDVAWKTYQEQWSIGMNGRRGSGKSVLVACHDDYIYIYIYIYYDTKPSDGEASVLELWGIWNTPSLPLLLGPL